MRADGVKVVSPAILEIPVLVCRAVGGANGGEGGR